MSKQPMVTLRHIITVFNDIFDHMDGVMQALAKRMTELKGDLYFTVKFVRQMQSNYYAEVTPTMAMPVISAHVDPFQKLRSFRK